MDRINWRTSDCRSYQATKLQRMIPSCCLILSYECCNAMKLFSRPRALKRHFRGKVTGAGLSSSPAFAHWLLALLRLALRCSRDHRRAVLLRLSTYLATYDRPATKTSGPRSQLFSSTLATSSPFFLNINLLLHQQPSITYQSTSQPVAKDE
jgi:hypothetical protein